MAEQAEQNVADAAQEPFSPEENIPTTNSNIQQNGPTSNYNIQEKTTSGSRDGSDSSNEKD